MSERDREKVYWRLCLFFALVSPLSVLMTARAGFRPDFSPVYFALIGFLSIPFAVLVDLLRAMLSGEPVRVWVVRPTVNVGRSLAQPFEQARALAVSRLRECGFDFATVSSEGGAEVIKFGKAKSPVVYSFIEHGFSGEMTLKQTGAGSALSCKLTFDDTLLVDTGERERLTALCDYFTLKSQGFACEVVPMTLYCGLTLSFVTVLLTLTPVRVIGDLFLTCLSASALGLLAVSVVLILKDREGLFGFRLIFAGLCLASAPFAAKLVSLML